MFMHSVHDLNDRFNFKYVMSLDPGDVTAESITSNIDLKVMKFSELGLSMQLWKGSGNINRISFYIFN